MGKKSLGYEFFEKIFKFYIRKSQWEFDFLTIFLLFSRVPGAVGEFFAFYFFCFAVWAGEFFRLVWNSGGLGGGRVTIPRPPVSSYGWKIPHFYYTFSDFQGLTRKVQTWGGTPPSRLNPPAGKPHPPNRTREKLKREKFTNSLWNPRKWSKSIFD